ncbi:MAG: MFS transporter [Candidatus Pacebacteria bacterium]|nr:MFS transporter [Candidatus Paceibacterota bacterium]
MMVRLSQPRNKIHPAWWVLMASFLLLITATGIRSANGVLLLPLEAEFGWSRAAISSSISISLILYGLAGPFSASLVARFGIRRIMIIALVMVVLGVLGATQISQIWHLTLLWGVLIGLGTGMAGLSVSAIIVDRWFLRHRGLVQGILTASFATGALVFLPLLEHLALSFGWRWAIAFMAGFGMLVIPVVAIFIRNFPRDRGVEPYGFDHPEGRAFLSANPRKTGATVADANVFLLPLQVLRQSAKNLNFWLLFLTFFICGLSTNGLIGTHLIAACEDVGISSRNGAWLLATMGLFDLVGTVGSGYLTDRFDSRKLLFAYYGFRGLSLMALPFILTENASVIWLSVFAVFYGLDWVATVPPTVKLATGILGRERVGMVFGWISAGHQLGAGVAAAGAGLIHTQYKSYFFAFLISGLACFIAALASISVNRRKTGQGLA